MDYYPLTPVSQVSQHGLPNPGVDFDSFEPQTRARSQTWSHPCRAPSPNSQTLHGGAGRLIPSEVQEEEEGAMMHDLSGESGGGTNGSGSGEFSTNSNNNCSSNNGGKKPTGTSSRRNAWGNLSYADLITQAIAGSPEKRLTLSQIYDWMVANIAYFKDKGEANSSAGWKNSIRHNLSLHNRFIRVQNEGTGKSSWWMLNPDARPGKAARRRAATLETSKFEKKRGRIKKKLDALRNGQSPTTLSSLLGQSTSSIGRFGSGEDLDIFPEESLLSSNVSLSRQQKPSSTSSTNSSSGYHSLSSADGFRPRASSNASSYGRLSPILSGGLRDVSDLPDVTSNLGDVVSSPWGDYSSTFNTDQLAGSFNMVKIQEEHPNFDFYPNYQQESGSSDYYEYGNHGCNHGQLTPLNNPSLIPIPTSTGSTPQQEADQSETLDQKLLQTAGDLSDFNFDQLGQFDVDEVLRSELSLADLLPVGNSGFDAQNYDMTSDHMNPSLSHHHPHHHHHHTIHNHSNLLPSQPLPPSSQHHLPLHMPMPQEDHNTQRLNKSWVH